ncbi:hypothetical protein RJJ65_38630, partial [Rhizobium hidalgonense]|nr:hypothetical protein [Rhizobium hidalgonense]
QVMHSTPTDLLSQANNDNAVITAETTAVNACANESHVPPLATSQVELPKTNLLGLSRPQMEAFFESMGEKKFRATQVLKWIHQFGVADFDQMTNLAGKLREKLKQVAYVQAPEIVHKNFSKDGTRKWVFRVGDG